MAEQPLRVELEQEADGCWLAEVVQLPGVLAYGPRHRLWRYALSRIVSNMASVRQN